MNGNTCVTECPSDHYLTNQNGIYKCFACDTNCKTCIQTSTKCLSCKTNYLFLNNECFENNCPDGYYQEEGECIQCDSNCKTCV